MNLLFFTNFIRCTLRVKHGSEGAPDQQCLRDFSVESDRLKVEGGEDCVLSKRPFGLHKPVGTFPKSISAKFEVNEAAVELYFNEATAPKIEFINEDTSMLFLGGAVETMSETYIQDSEHA